MPKLDVIPRRLAIVVLVVFAGTLLVWQSSSGSESFPGMVLRDGVLHPQEPLRDGEEPATGLQKRFPELVQPAENPTTLERVELGRFLFFDPILSGDNTASCAHCHHPDLGFSDALPRARGRGAHGVGKSRKGGVEL